MLPCLVSVTTGWSVVSTNNNGLRWWFSSTPAQESTRTHYQSELAPIATRFVDKIAAFGHLFGGIVIQKQTKLHAAQ